MVGIVCADPERFHRQPPDAMIPRFADPKAISVVVVGGEKNAYWFATDFGHLKTASVDDWR